MILHKRIIGSWQKSFSKNIQDFNAINSGMHTIQRFLSEKYDKLKVKIDREIKGGASYFSCFSCKHHSMKKECVLGELHLVSCMVCNIRSRCLFFVCPDCGGDIFVGMEFNGQCIKCNILVDASLKLKYFNDSSQIAYCGECFNLEHETVVSFYGKFLCLNCFTMVDYLGDCEFCSQRWLNGEEDTYVHGCEFCDGAFAWER